MVVWLNLIQVCHCHRNAAAVVGTLVIGRLILRELGALWSGFRAFFLAPMGLGRTNLRKYGSWAGQHALNVVLTSLSFLLPFLVYTCSGNWSI